MAVTDDDPWDNPYDPERIAKDAAETITTTAFYAYHPDERKARARQALRYIIEQAFRRNEHDGLTDSRLERLWNIMAGHDG